MKVILNCDVPNLGEEGDICEVARGYARNFLIPRNMVLMHNRQNSALIEGRRAAIEQRKVEKRKQASSMKEQIESEPLVFTMAAGDRGKLFGSVTTATIVDELDKRGISVERRKVDIPDGTIKSVGTHSVRVRLYGEEEAELTVRVETEAVETASKNAAAAAAAPAPAAPPVESTPVESVTEEPETGMAETEKAEPDMAEATSEESDATEESSEQPSL
ncbi:MAG: 50S ribosomal protein L9 [Spirochaetaceae bacterium]|nr:MAG: 50S ribosomal protein L9 [Spirochaetaceae bacterium]